jgi:SAM-dependent methyltransferase
VTSARQFGELTEAPGGWVSTEGARMLYTRYDYGARQSRGARVLELGCGPGVGLGLLSDHASFVVGGDFDQALLRRARGTYAGRIPLVRLDVQALPFSDGAFDVVLFFEASYYVPDMERGFDEITRVLVPGGRVVFVNANPERPDFIPSPMSVHYHSVAELRSALERRGYVVRAEGAFAVGDATWGGRILMTIRRLARRLGVIPDTLRGRALLKRLLRQRLVPVPPRLTEGFDRPSEREPLRPGESAGSFKVVYVTGERSGPDARGGRLARPAR